MLQITKKELELLEKVVNHVSTAETEYFVTSTFNKTFQRLEQIGAIQSRQKPGNALRIELAPLQLAADIVKSNVEHEIVETLPAEGLDANPFAEQAFGVETAQAQQELAPATASEAKKVEYDTEFVIDDNVQIPEKFTRAGSERPSPYPLEKLAVGQSFAVPPKEGEPLNKARRRIAVSISQTRKRKGIQAEFHIQAMPNENAVRVWRKA